MEAAYGRVGVLLVNEGKNHAGLDVVLGDRPAEQADHVHPALVERARLVEQHAVRMRDPEDVVTHLTFGGGRGRGRLEEDALGRPDVIGGLVDVHLILSHRRMGLDAEDAGVDEREVAHVEEVFHRPRRRAVHADRGRVQVPPIRLAVLGDVEQAVGR